MNIQDSPGSQSSASPVSGRLFIPDGSPVHEALRRTTHLGVGAHHDDLEFMAFHGIVECFGKHDKWFAGVTCADGKGSSRGGAYASLTPEQLAETRSEEQIQAAGIGGYGAMIQLDYPSSRITTPSDPALRADLCQILQATSPEVVYTHNPADKHATHIGVFASLLEAIRSLPPSARPRQLIGCEVWRDLDWMCDSEKVRMDATGHDCLASRLNAVFASQIGGGKRYDLAVAGRRAANATFYEPREGDESTQVLVGMDLTPLILDDRLGVVEFTRERIRRFENEVVAGLSAYFKT
jgi:LmbE family N-acetylglucosaminyl deacetylase